jgi:predicted methyltransferase
VNSLAKCFVAVVCLAGLSSTAQALSPDFMDRLQAESRPAEDTARDGARRPYQVMELLGVEDGMTAVDVGAGGGWWTYVFSAAVGPNGKVYAQGLRGGNAGDLPNVEVVSDVPANTADVAITALNLHHSNDERGMAAMQTLKSLLKPGGVAAVIDHVGDPSIDNSRLHRIPIATVRTWIRNAGFEIVSEPDILRQNADDHTMSSTDPRLGRNSDRFMFVVRKPR